MKRRTKHNPSVNLAMTAIVLPEAVFQGSERQIPPACPSISVSTLQRQASKQFQHPCRLPLIR